MTASSIKWTIYSIASIALCVWLVHVSRHHTGLEKKHKALTELRDAQLQTIATWQELAQKVRIARNRETSERRSMRDLLGYFREKELSSDVLKAFEMPSDNYALYTRNGIGRGFFLLPDEESEVVAYVRMLTPGEGRERTVKHLRQTLESPDRRVVLPAQVHHLTEYQFDTIGPPGELEFGCRLTDKNEIRLVPFCDVENSYEKSGSGGPYNDGIFKNHEYEVTFGWPALSELSFIKTLQEHGIWLIACNEVFRSANRPVAQSKPLHVVLVFASTREWKIHPDYQYCRSLNAGFDLEWDPQQENYLAVPKPSE